MGASTHPLGSSASWPQGILDSFASAGFFWGGNFKSRKDPMHFPVGDGVLRYHFQSRTSGVESLEQVNNFIVLRSTAKPKENSPQVKSNRLTMDIASSIE